MWVVGRSGVSLIAPYRKTGVREGEDVLTTAEECSRQWEQHKQKP